jgi:S1-C subfamily serine protease
MGYYLSKGCQILKSNFPSNTKMLPSSRQWIFLLILGILVSVPTLLSARQKSKEPKSPIPRTDLISKIKSAVIQIAFQSNPPVPNGAGVAGTAFLVSQDGYAVTAAHVITQTKKMAEANGAKEVQFAAGVTLDTTSEPGAKFRGSFEWIPCTLLDIDEPHDIAILKLSRNPFSPFFNTGIVLGGKRLSLRVTTAKLQAELPAEGIELLVSGYPLSIPTLVTQRGTVASESFREIEINKPGAPPWFTVREAADMILADIVVNPGNSGGPFYLSDTGNVIGVCQGNVSSPVHWPDSSIVFGQRDGRTEPIVQNSGLAIVLPIKYAMLLLDKNKINYDH